MGREIALDQLTFISGGQTGIDRAVLDFCLEHQLPCGGWCPEGRLAEDGPIDRKYPVKELPGASYEDRTRANVAGSDATVILYRKEIRGGTQKSREYAVMLGKPFLMLDLDRITPAQAARKLIEFIIKENPSVVNFSGPRHSEWDQGYQHCLYLLKKVFDRSGFLR